jgi:chromate transporter
MVTFFAFLYAYYGDVDVLQRMFRGVAAAAAGLTVSTSLKMLMPMVQQRPGFPQVMALLAFVAIGVLRWPIYWVLLILIPLSIGLAWRTRGGAS